MNDADKLGLPPLEGFEGSIWDDTDDDRHYDRSGNKITIRDWFRLRHWDRLENEMRYTIVKQETIGDYWISTVWIGLDHNFMGTEPHIFETMVFRESTGESDLDCRRYSTEWEALQGHEEMAAEVRLFSELEGWRA